VNIKPIAWIRDGECIRCTSHSTDGDGYPHTHRNGKLLTVARQIVLRRFHVPPTGIVARHTCDHTWCINPAHLLSGSQYDNITDMDSRGRRKPRKGTDHGRSKLTDDDVRHIRSSAGSTLSVSESHGISKAQVRRIKRREQWRHLS
jgi:hypothetical protein